jgi:hypothetical protein
MIALPPDTRAAVHSVAAPDGSRPWIVMVAVGFDPGIDATPRAGTVSAVLSHDRGLAFPDAKGIAYAQAVLAEGGTVAPCFAQLADALECQRRLRKAGAR